VGRRWVQSSRFVNRTGPQAFAALEAKLRAAVARGERPQVIFDLDQTLYSNVRREQQALNCVASDAALPAPVREKLLHVRVREAWYGIDDAFSFSGLSLKSRELAPLEAELRQDYKDGLTQAEVDRIDPPYPGAAAFVNKLHAMGADIVYLSARGKATSGAATASLLRRDGFPIGDERARLVMKEDPSLSDRDFKRDALAAIGREGKVVGTFDNEPSNVVNLKRAFPDAVNVFVDTAASRTAADPIAGIYRIEGWRPGARAAA
jgi:predicted secreted acid phosphatase